MWDVCSSQIWWAWTAVISSLSLRSSFWKKQDGTVHCTPDFIFWNATDRPIPLAAFKPDYARLFSVSFALPSAAHNQPAVKGFDSVWTAWQSRTALSNWELWIYKTRPENQFEFSWLFRWLWSSPFLWSLIWEFGCLQTDSHMTDSGWVLDTLNPVSKKTKHTAYCIHLLWTCGLFSFVKDATLVFSKAELKASGAEVWPAPKNDRLLRRSILWP